MSPQGVECVLAVLGTGGPVKLSHINMSPPCVALRFSGWSETFKEHSTDGGLCVVCCALCVVPQGVAHMADDTAHPDPRHRLLREGACSH
eukprot:516229-Prorocentrum_minimum.AAC.1